MTNEEWDRKVEFLLNQQAKHDAVMQELDQKLKEAEASSKRQFKKLEKAAELTEESLSQLADATLELISTMTAGFLSTSDRIKESNDKIDVLVSNHIHTDDRIRDSYKRMKDSQQKLLENDKKLLDLTAQFERHMRKYHRGRKASEN